MYMFVMNSVFVQTLFNSDQVVSKRLKNKKRTEFRVLFLYLF